MGPVVLLERRPLYRAGDMQSAARFAQTLEDVYRTLHIAPVGFSLCLPLLGAITGNASLDARATALLISLAFAFHIFAYGLNDVIDLPLDRTERRRARDPLVRGALSPRLLLTMPLLAVPVGFLIAIAARLPLRSVIALAIAFGCMTLYDVWGKRCTKPWCTDAVQGVAWAALAFTGVPPGSTAGAGVPLLLSVVVAFVLLVNGVLGPLRDLKNDYARGASTTVIALGGRPHAGGVYLPPRLSAYAVVLHAVVAGLAGLMLRTGSPAVIGCGAGLAAVATGLQIAAYRLRCDLSRMAVVGAIYLAVSFALLLLAAGQHAQPQVQVVLAALLFLPVTAMFFRHGGTWP